LTKLETLTETASGFAKQTRESIEELGRCAGRKLDAARDETGTALHSAVSSVRSTGRNSSAVIDNCSTHTADSLDATASYIVHRRSRPGRCSHRRAKACASASDRFAGRCGGDWRRNRSLRQPGDTLLRENRRKYATVALAPCSSSTSLRSASGLNCDRKCSAAGEIEASQRCGFARSLRVWHG
jgi:hypothetical protein